MEFTHLQFRNVIGQYATVMVVQVSYTPQARLPQ